MVLRLVRFCGPAIVAALALTGCDNSPAITHYVLALSWQPAFCEFNVERPECRDLDGADFAATNLTVHGLWPNDRPDGGPSHCKVDAKTKELDEERNWCALPAPKIADKTRAALSSAMPGIASCLDRHEWVKHGTCTGLGAERYFGETLRLAREVQATRLGQVITGHIGRNVTPQQLRNAFEAEFGAGSGKALTLVCRERNGRRYLAEIRIALQHSAFEERLERRRLYLEGAPADSCESDMWVDSAG